MLVISCLANLNRQINQGFHIQQIWSRNIQAPTNREKFQEMSSIFAALGRRAMAEKLSGKYYAELNIH